MGLIEEIASDCVEIIKKKLEEKERIQVVYYEYKSLREIWIKSDKTQILLKEEFLSDGICDHKFWQIKIYDDKGLKKRILALTKLGFNTTYKVFKTIKRMLENDKTVDIYIPKKKEFEVSKAKQIPEELQKLIEFFAEQGFIDVWERNENNNIRP